jgi:hypothetical protein
LGDGIEMSHDVDVDLGGEVGEGGKGVLEGVGMGASLGMNMSSSLDLFWVSGTIGTGLVSVLSEDKGRGRARRGRLDNDSHGGA